MLKYILNGFDDETLEIGFGFSNDEIDIMKSDAYGILGNSIGIRHVNFLFFADSSKQNVINKIKNSISNSIPKGTSNELISLVCQSINDFSWWMDGMFLMPFVLPSGNTFIYIGFDEKAQKLLLTDDILFPVPGHTHSLRFFHRQNNQQIKQHFDVVLGNYAYQMKKPFDPSWN